MAARKTPAVQCGAPTRAGKTCTAPPAHGDTRCRAHSDDPAVREALALERRKGGLQSQLRGAVARLPGDMAAQLDSEGGVRRLLERAADDVHRGAISPAAANALAGIAKVAIDVVRLALEGREVEIAAAIAEARGAKIRKRPIGVEGTTNE